MRQVGGQGVSQLPAMGRSARKSHNDPAVERAQSLIAAALGSSGGATTLSVRAARPLGTLWAGYGTITEVETDDEGSRTLIVKVRHGPAQPARGIPANRLPRLPPSRCVSPRVVLRCKQLVRILFVPANIWRRRCTPLPPAASRTSANFGATR